jgi:hypothetical protein
VAASKLLRSKLISKPEALFAALGRLMASASETRTVGTDQKPVTSASPTTLSPATLLPKLQSLVVLVLKLGLKSSDSASAVHQEEIHDNSIAMTFARLVLSGPGGDELSEDIKVGACG